MATYYVSNSGNDSNDGLSTGTPVLTLSEADSLASSGDTVLLERGGIWRESIDIADGTDGSPTTIGAYGSGAKPIISGADLVSSWTLDSGSIYYASVAASFEVKQLIVNGTRLDQSRFPKTGFLTTDAVNANLLEISDAALTQADDYWIGAKIAIRTTDYTWEFEDVTDFVNSTGTVIVGNAFDQLGTDEPDRDYFFRNSRSELTQAGEWCYVASEDRVYLWMPDSSDPSLATVEVSARETAIGNFNSEYTNVDNIQLQHFSDEAILCGGISPAVVGNWNITNCDFVENIRDMWALGTDITVSNCTSTNAEGKGFFMFQVANGTIEFCDISNVGLREGYGSSGVGGCIGIHYDTCTNMDVSNNILSSTGYNGITANCDGGVVENNIILDAMRTLNDGAALYCWGSSTQNVIWRNNFCDGTNYNSDLSLGTFDYYIDNDCENITIENCISKSPAYGSLLVNADSTNCTIQDNVFFGFVEEGIQIADWAGATTGGHVIQNNVFHTTSATASVVKLVSAYARAEDLATFTNNIYGNTQSDLLAYIGGYGDTSPDLTLELWQSEQPEQNATSTYIDFADVVLLENRTNSSTIITGNYETLLGVLDSSIDLDPYSGTLVRVAQVRKIYSASSGKKYIVGGKLLTT